MTLSETQKPKEYGD